MTYDQQGKVNWAYYFVRYMGSNLAICNKALKNVQTLWFVNCTSANISDMWIRIYIYIYVFFKLQYRKTGHTFKIQ